MKSRTAAAIGVLRVSAALIFIGHGAFALQGKPAWLAFFAPFGFDPATARVLLSAIGALDVALGIVVLVRPIPALLLWMTLWGLWTAILRVIVGQSVFEFIERSGNWGAPLALLLILGVPDRLRDWLRPARLGTDEPRSSPSSP